MKLNAFKSFLASIWVFASVNLATGEEKAMQISRDGDGLKQIKTIAVLPVAVQLFFDKGSGTPDTNDTATRFQAADNLAGIMCNKAKAQSLNVLEPEVASLAMKLVHLQPVDFYTIKVSGNRQTPAETLRNRSDQFMLLELRKTMLQTPEDMTVFQVKWSQLPDVREGLAAFRKGAQAKPNITNLQRVNERLHVDALMLCQVTDFEAHDVTGGDPFSVLLSRDAKDTTLHVHAMLVRTSDGKILWEADAKGNGQETTRSGNSVASNKLGMIAIAQAGKSADLLLANLINGNGGPNKR